MRIFILLFVTIMGIGASVRAQSVITNSTPGSYYFLVPCGTTSVTIEAWGGGGGGGSASGNGGPSAGAGGGGAYSKYVFTVAGGETFNIVIGAGGAAGTGNGGNGGNGSNSTFQLGNGGVFVAGGGFGGSAGIATSLNGTGGAGGVGTGAGVTTFSGGKGANGSGGTTGTLYGGGGGSSAGTAANGNNAANGTGAAAVAGGGAGGNGGASGGGAGVAGAVPGGGGGGARKSGGGAAVNGGAGANGQIKITYTSAFKSYCSAGSLTSTVYPITRVKFATLDNFSSAATTSPDYERFCSPITTVYLGTTYSIRLEGNAPGTNVFYFTVFIDWNIDGDFADAGERFNIGQITGTSGTDGVNITGNITVPAGATSGLTTMRVMKIFGTTAPTSSCGDFNYAQTEDYALDVRPIGPCTGTPFGGYASNTPTIGGISAVVSLTSNLYTLATGMTYQWQSSTDLTTWTNVAGATTINSTVTSPSTFGVIYYRLKITCTASGQSGYSTVVSYNANTCLSNSTPSRTSQVYFDKVEFIGTLNDMVNTSSYDPSMGYQDFTGVGNYAKQAQNEGVNIYVQANRRALMKAWVDWDRNGTFDNTTEFVYGTNGILTKSTTFGFAVPATAVVGKYRLRIRCYNTSDITPATSTTYANLNPCDQIDNGETEDYTFEVVQACNAAVTSVFYGEACTSAATAITGTVSGNASTTSFNWYDNEFGGSVVANTTGSYTKTVSASDTMWVSAVSATCQSWVRTPVFFVVSPVPQLYFDPEVPSICGDMNYKIVATGDSIIQYLISATFNNGTTNGFVVSENTTPNAMDANSNWQNKTAVYVPNNTSVWAPAISPLVSNDKFMYTASDFNSGISAQPTTVNAYLTSTTLNTTGLASLTLKYSLFYDRYFSDGTNTADDFFNVEISTDGGTTWTALQNFTSDQGYGTRFSKQYLELNPMYLNQTNLKIRFYYHAVWCNGAAIDNVFLYGKKALGTNFSWSPTNGGNVFTDAAGTIPYTGGIVNQIFIKPTAAQMEAGNDLNFTASATMSNGCVASKSIVVKVLPNSWVGSISNDWHDPLNWCGKAVPTVNSKVWIDVVPAGYFYPTITAAAFSNTLSVFAGASLTINASGSLEMKGNFDNLGTFTNNGTISFTGNGVNQNFPGAGTIAAMNKIVIDKGILQLNKSLDVTGGVVPTQGGLGFNGNNITLKSTATGTAYLGEHGSSFAYTYGTGRYIVERYIGVNQKKWQFLTAPVQAEASIFNSWQEGGNNTNGFGTQISGTTGAAGGFDYQSYAAGIKTYVQATDSWLEVPNTSNNISNLAGYMIYVRGNRTVGATTPATVATLRAKGKANTGDFNGPSIAATKLQSLGNPYPCAIDFTKFRTATKNSSLENGFTAWDPYVGGTYGQGVYIALSATNGWVSTVSGTIYNNAATNKIIQSGQAFFVKNIGASAITPMFSETDKNYTSKLVNKNEEDASNTQYFRVKLVRQDGVEIDGNATAFSDKYKDAIDGDDMHKIYNPAENFGLSRSGQSLAIEGRGMLKDADTVFFQTKNLTNQTYSLKFEPKNFDEQLYDAFLIDNFDGSRRRVRLDETNELSINITTDAASKANDRFYVVFINKSKMFDDWIVINGLPINNDEANEISWSLNFAERLASYRLEHSVDGMEFNAINLPLAKFGEDTMPLSYVDVSPAKSLNYYRIVATTKSGAEIRSKVIALNNGAVDILVRPTLVQNRTTNIQFANTKGARYNLVLTTGDGKLIAQRQLYVQSGATIKYLLPKNTAKGVYTLNIYNGQILIKTEKLAVQ